MTKEKEAQLRKLYSQELASKEKSAAEKLLKDALDTKDDAVMQFQLLNLAYQKAAEIFDFSHAFKAADEMGMRYSDVHATGLKARALDDARKRKPRGEQAEALVIGDLEFAIQLVLMGQANSSHYDEAVKAAKNALAGAKAAKNRILEDKAEAIQKYAVDLGKDKADALSLARFKYFIVDDSGEAVVNALANGSDAKLKRLFGLQLVGGKSAAHFYEFGDVAYEAAIESSRIPFERIRLLNDAKGFYDRAVSTATGIEKTQFERDEKLKKRMADIQSKLVQHGGVASTLGIDLLGAIDPTKDAVQGICKREGSSIVLSNLSGHACMQIPFAPPEEYDLHLVVQKKEGTSPNHCLVLGLRTFTVLLDAWGGTMSGLHLLDGKSAKNNDTTYTGSLFKPGIASSVTCQVRKDRISVVVDGKPIVTWNGEVNRLSLAPDLPRPNSKAVWLGLHESTYVASKIRIVPLSGRGEALR